MFNCLLSPLRHIGHITVNAIWKLGFFTRFFGMLIMHSGQSLRKFHMVIREVYFAGVLSLLIIIVSGLFVGMVLGLQGYTILAKFGSSDVLGMFVALALLRELGPVLAALLFSSRAGSSMTAEIGLMKTTDQLDAMSVMAVNPLARVVAPKFLAGIISMPILSALFNIMGILGGYIIGVLMVGLDEGAFWSQMQANIDFYIDVVNGLIKSVIFGIVVTLIAVFEGYNAEPTASGVSAATTRTVVTSALVILALDFILTAFMF